MESSYVTHQLFFTVIGGVSGAVLGIVLYWIAVIKSIGKILETHRENDAKEFAEYKLANQKIQSELQRYVDTKHNETKEFMIGIAESIKYTKESVDEIKNYIKEKK